MVDLKTMEVMGLTTLASSRHKWTTWEWQAPLGQGVAWALVPWAAFRCRRPQPNGEADDCEGGVAIEAMAPVEFCQEADRNGS